MSSFLGHSLAGLTVYAIDRQLLLNQNQIVVAASNRTAHRQNWLWLIWLVTIASIPDIDYLIPAKWAC
jgi:inner membrane protein